MPCFRRFSVLVLAAALALPAAGQEATAPSPPAAGAVPAIVSVDHLRQQMHRADRFLVEGRFQEAIEPLKLVTSVQPQHAGAWLMLSKALQGAGRTADAVDAARHAVTLLEAEKPERRAAWMPAGFYLQLGRACAVTGDLACAETALRRADREQPDSAEILRELGSLLARQAKDAEAVGVLRHALSLDAASPRAGVELGNALLRLGDTAGAEAAFRAASALAPEEPEPWFGLSAAAQARGDDAAHAAALETFEKLSTARDARLDATRRLEDALRAAGDHLGAGRFADAAAGYEAALSDPLLADGPRRPVVLVDLGRSRLRAGDVPGAAAALEEASRLAPGLAAAALELGNLLAGRGLVDEAFPHLLRAVEDDPLQAPAHASLSMAWAALGRLDEALAEALKASLLEPNDLALRQQYVDLLATTGRVAEADALAVRGGVTPPGGKAPAPSPAGTP